MDALKITGGRSLSGDLHVSGSKNASLPIIAVALLARGTSVLRGVPDLADVKTLGYLLEAMGAQVRRENLDLVIDTQNVDKPYAPYDLVRTMRASFVVLGPLLARFGHAKVSLPGGCAIGARPVDQHLKGLERLGANIQLDQGYVIADAPRGLIGADFTFEVQSVTGTENLIMAACLAKGTTILRNCAQEPEVSDVAQALISMGAKIKGVGTSTLEIEGVQSLKPYDYRVMPDRIEFGTFLVAGALLGRDLRVVGGIIEHQKTLIEKLQEAGVEIKVEDNAVTVQRIERSKPLQIDTAPYPGFPTDMQAQLMVLMSLAQGESTVSENIFENRFMHVAELGRLGAQVKVGGGTATIEGVSNLSGTTVMATDLRASASLVLAGLVADGQTVIRRIYHLDRGYEHIEAKLKKVGAQIERFREN
jgi:UDP-N-acetylglucosamine 1-carboxyvinyltransferase